LFIWDIQKHAVHCLHVRSGGEVESLVEAGGTIEHVEHVVDLARVESEWLVELDGKTEHISHVKYCPSVQSEWLVEGGSIGEHAGCNSQLL